MAGQSLTCLLEGRRCFGGDAVHRIAFHSASLPRRLNLILRIDLILDIVSYVLRTTRPIALAGLVAIACSCSSGPATASSGKPVIAAAFYPIEEIVRSVDGSAVDVVTLVPPGQEAHEYEPSARQVGDLQKAKFVFYLGDGFQPDVEKAVASLPDAIGKIDLLKSIDLLPASDKRESLSNAQDPHVWLDPQNMIVMTKVVAKALDVDASSYIGELQKLDDSFRTGLAHCTSHVIVTSHQAFAYLAHAYGLTQIPIAGISPTDEPSAKTLQAVAETAKKNNVSTIFFEHNLPDDLAKTVADEVGAKTAVLDPLESLSKDQLDAGATYISVMTADLATLRSGLGCT
jgi:zinc transport system substrate-binding protein